MSFYDSNYDTFITPQEEGWFIGYKTESGDAGFIGPYDEVRDIDHALEILKEAQPDEMENGHFHSRVIKVAYYNGKTSQPLSLARAMEIQKLAQDYYEDIDEGTRNRIRQLGWQEVCDYCKSTKIAETDEYLVSFYICSLAWKGKSKHADIRHLVDSLRSVTALRPVLRASMDAASLYGFKGT